MSRKHEKKNRRQEGGLFTHCWHDSVHAHRWRCRSRRRTDTFTVTPELQLRLTKKLSVADKSCGAPFDSEISLSIQSHQRCLIITLHLHCVSKSSKSKVKLGYIIVCSKA